MPKKKVSMVLLIVIISISALAVYYLESGPGSNSSLGSPSLVYDFNGTILSGTQNGHTYFYSGSFLGWSVSGHVTDNETNAIVIYSAGSLSKQFKARNSEVNIGLEWGIDATMIISRQLGGVYQDLTYSYNGEDTTRNYTNTTSFEVDNNTSFTVQFETSGYNHFGTIIDLPAYVSRVRLWNSGVYP